MNDAPLVYSVSEACKCAKISRTVLYEVIKSGALIARKRGKRTLILHDDLCRYLQSLPTFNSNEAPDAV